ncbi:conserved hypothetical protein [Ignisphaera aggregans DSM 17230]|uniref:PIN domain-containing protein n=1 Tax=Ignisphaera aggregans (strain DSM 17230 / JCM 13409 / AQ1.S1) TaxID=583356 RepID=E0STA1_IGNAA|nr:conserved hypothetical protein [Ignisphaera aggregans DSM 17230]
MYYVDSNVLISYVFSTSEPYHTASQHFLEDLALGRGQKLYASSLTLVEACNAICRRIVREGSKLIDPLQRYVDLYRDVKDKCRFLTSLIIGFLMERLGIEFIDDESLYRFEPVNIDGMRIPKIFREALELSYKINLRVKDLLHIVYAYTLSNIYGIKFFLTHDIEDFERVKEEVKRLLRIEIILVK